jgi:hypothetical protein
MNRYQLASHWHLDASIERVWAALYDVASWPKWWPYVQEVEELEAGDAGGVGALRRFTWGSALPYQLTFTMRTSAVERPYILEAIAEGELSGIGRWTLIPRGPAATEVRYDWEVSTSRTWMNVMAPVLGPMFRWNHGQVMAAGAQGLSQYLGARPGSHY